MSDYDVAIVGYGPTGMTLAALLGKLGRRVLVLERSTEHMRGGNTRHTRNIRPDSRC